MCHKCEDLAAIQARQRIWQLEAQLANSEEARIEAQEDAADAREQAAKDRARAESAEQALRYSCMPMKCGFGWRELENTPEKASGCPQEARK